MEGSIMPGQVTNHRGLRTPQVNSGQKPFASPGFCRIDSKGIHVLNRYRSGHLIPWDEIEAVSMPGSQCRHDYLKVLTRAKDFANAIPVADRDHAKTVLDVIFSYKPELSRAN